MTIPLKTRLKAAHRVLFKTGKDAFICSFCGKGRDEAKGNIIAGPGVAICAGCARVASAWNLIDRFDRPPGTAIVTFEIFYEHQACLLDAARGRLDADLRRCAALLGVQLAGWSYSWGKGAFVDGLSVYVPLPTSVNAAIFYETFAQTYLKLDCPAEGERLMAPWISKGW